jgi:hypothetical protein
MCQPRKFRRKDTLEDMSPDMQTLLIHCTSRGVHPKEFTDEKARWSTSTREALERHGLIYLGKNAKGKDLWRATEEGRRVVGAHAPRLLMPTGRPRRVDDDGSCYTHIPAFAMRQEPEAA